MKKSTLYYIWGGAYALCGLLSLIGKPSAVLQVVMTLFSLGFFVPPVALLVKAFQEQDTKTVKLLRLISILSLGLTVLVFLLNILSMGWSEAMGNFLYYTLVFLSVPMVCSGHYALSLFLWACLMFSTFLKFKKKQPGTPVKSQFYRQ